VDAIVAVRDRVVRNLRITECYHRLSAAMTARTGRCANWCTFAVWASRQAGRTIRGEDLVESLSSRLRAGASLRRPVLSLWRALLRKGVFQPETRLGRLVRAIHTPFDPFELASEAVAAGNLKVFAEIGREFARFLSAPDFAGFLEGLRLGDPPDGQQLLRQAFTRYHELPTNAQAVFLANLEIAVHEQTRLQPEIRAALEAGPAALNRAVPWWKRMLFAPYLRYVQAVTRSVVTECLMVLALPATTLALGQHLDRVSAEPLREVSDPELAALLARYEPEPPAEDDCAARDWTELDQRLHYAIHLFRAFHLEQTLLNAPFTPQQVAVIEAGRLPGGNL
jgi:hypothetical protein